ncbi:MAG: flavin reductase family protein [Burkholderiaceae bacterium]
MTSPSELNLGTDPGQEPISMLSASDFTSGMRLQACTVCVVTTAHAGVPSGMTVTTLVSVSVQPPTLLICAHDASHCGAAIRESGRFCVNLLKDTAATTADLFAGRTGIFAAERFDNVGWQEGDDGCPVLTDALIAFECRLESATRVATHWLFVGRPIHLHNQGGDPLVYADRAFRALAETDLR